MSYVVKIGKPGKDVLDCTDEELYYSSDWNNWKIYSEGSVSLSIPADDSAFNYGYADVTHSLGYVPAVEAVAVMNGYSNQIPGPDDQVLYQFDMYIDSSKVRFTGADVNAVGSANVTIKYKIYYEQIGQ